MRKVFCLLLSSILASLLLACSGSGSSVGDLGSPATLSADQSEAVDVLNHLRSHAGLPTVVPYTKLMDAASAHSNYLTLNPTELGHIEIPGRPGFTGVTPTDRAKVAGIDDPVAESVISWTTGYSTSYKIWSMLSAPYHGLFLTMSPYKKIGIGNAPDNMVIEMSDYGYFNSNLLVYPCGGVSVPAMSSRGEIPDPLVQFGLSLDTNPTGTPIYISAGDTIRSVDLSLVKDGSSTQEGLYPVLTVDNDKNIQTIYFAIGMPRNPLQPGAGYALKVNVTHKNGKTSSKSCKFTTF